MCPALCDPTDCHLPGSSVRGILQARIPEWVAMPSHVQPRDGTPVSCLLRWQVGSLPLEPGELIKNTHSWSPVAETGSSHPMEGLGICLSSHKFPDGADAANPVSSPEAGSLSTSLPGRDFCLKVGGKLYKHHCRTRNGQGRRWR